MPLGLFCLRENDPLHLTLAFIPSSSIEEFYFCPTAINAFNVNIYHGYLLSARLQMLVKLIEPLMQQSLFLKGSSPAAHLS